MTLWSLIFWAGAMGVVALFAIGVAFLVVPNWTMAVVDHSQDKLPLAMGARYIFFGAALLGALFYPDKLVLMGVLLGFAGVAAIDAVIYWGEQAAPHMAAGVLCCVASYAVYRTRKVAV